MSKSLVKASLKERYGLKQKLGELAAEAMALSEQIARNGGELTPEVEAALEVNQLSIMRKIDNYSYIEDQFQAQADLFKRKADALYEIARSYEKEIDRLRSRIKYVMKELNKDEIKGEEHRYVLSKSATKLVIDDPSLIPSSFQMVVQKTEIDREKLRQALTNGFEVPGAHIEENGTLRKYENSGKE